MEFLFKYAEVMAINMPLLGNEKIEEELKKVKESESCDSIEDCVDGEDSDTEDNMKKYSERFKKWWAHLKKNFYEPFQIHDTTAQLRV